MQTTIATTTVAPGGAATAEGVRGAGGAVAAGGLRGSGAALATTLWPSCRILFARTVQVPVVLLYGTDPG